MSAGMPCDAAGADRQLEARERIAEAALEIGERVYKEERAAFLVACNDCALKLPRSGETPWYVVFQDLLYLDNPGSWAKRRELFKILLSTGAGQDWLGDMATEYALKQADDAESEAFE